MSDLMNKIIMIKYGELSTKKGNRSFFINKLYENIKNKLDGLDVSITKDRARMYIEFKDSDLDKIKDVIDNTFGIHEYDLAYVCNSLEDEIVDRVFDIVKDMDFNTFKVICKRSDKSFKIHSQDMNRLIASKSIDNISVDVHEPDLYINVEIREKNTYIYFNKYSGLGGYPVGTQPKSLLMLSGGIDSPVAFYLALKRGIEVEAVYFEAIPHTSLNAREKVITLCRKMLKYSNKIKLHVINFTPIQEEIYKNCREDYVITIMRRMMYRIMDKMCNKYDAYSIINGESIGQVASQTLNSMRVINYVTNYPVIRPIACLDKLEIIDISKKIDTYETSILPYEDCCTVFVPKHPVINPNLDTCEKEESKFEWDSLIDKAINSELIIDIVEENSDLL